MYCTHPATLPPAATLPRCGDSRLILGENSDIMCAMRKKIAIIAPILLLVLGGGCASSNGNHEENKLYEGIFPVTNISIQSYYAKHKPWMLKPKRTGDVIATYGKTSILVDMGGGQMVEEGDEFIIFKGSHYKGSAKAIEVFSDKSLCKVLYTSTDCVIAVGDKATTKLSE